MCGDDGRLTPEFGCRLLRKKRYRLLSPVCGGNKDGAIDQNKQATNVSHFSNDLGLDSLDTVEVVMAIEEVCARPLFEWLKLYTDS